MAQLCHHRQTGPLPAELPGRFLEFYRAEIGENLNVLRDVRIGGELNIVDNVDISGDVIIDLD